MVDEGDGGGDVRVVDDVESRNRERVRRVRKRKRRSG